MRKVYPALLSVIEDGSYFIRVPDIDGCITTAATIEEAFDNIRDALACTLCSYEDYNDPIPDPSPVSAVVVDGSTAILVDVDTVEYRKETDTRAVRKNVSLPAWMSYLADKKGINCSQVLQDALRLQFDSTT